MRAGGGCLYLQVFNQSINNCAGRWFGCGLRLGSGKKNLLHKYVNTHGQYKKAKPFF